MSTQSVRFQAIQRATERSIVKYQPKNNNPSEYFASNVFTDELMQSYITKEAYQDIKNSIEASKPISREIAGQVATAMKKWAIEKGATHYTHWFQPLTGLTAEKHDSFYEVNNGKALEKFTGELLVQQEPDASSLPSGGLRNTFEARGYTAWDPSSPAFIYENTSGKTLCIPTIFVSYNGQALDFKAPLLKSIQALNKAAVKVGKMLDKKIEKIDVTLGVEQEYFLVDKALFNARPDLLMCGRTLFGAPPAKGQQMEDHYFGSIPDRVFNYMYELEVEALKLGIPLKTRHNEVAPGQYECAPMFENVNLAVDHNQLLIDLMEDIATKHHFVVLFHEKPFKGINGSGKHNNWSMSTNNGINLLSPGNNPERNLLFLTFFINVIKAVHTSADLIRASIASASNDHRLGANEAPPAIISIFIGSTLTRVLEEFLNPSKNSPSHENSKTIQVAHVPDILVDNTDRNRTSPFAFTGNKFELRAVGSSKNCSSPMATLNAAVAHQLEKFYDIVNETIKNEKLPIKDVIINTLKEELNSALPILFEGNGYSKEWEIEAKNRGLSNLKSTPDALKPYLNKELTKIFTETGILSQEEIEARYEIEMEDYSKKIEIETNLGVSLVNTYYLPASIKYQEQLATQVETLNKIKLNSKGQFSILEKANTLINNIILDSKKLSDYIIQSNAISNNTERAYFLNKNVISTLNEIRSYVDQLEDLIDNSLWPMPLYRELLFMK